MGLLGSMSVRFVADLTGLNSGVAQARVMLGGLASTPMSAAVIGIGAVTVATTALGVASVKAAGDYEATMNKVQALAGVSAKQAQVASDAIMKMASVVGQSPKALAEGLYYVASAGYNSTDSLKILEASAKAASVGMTSTETVANAMTAAMKAFNIPASQTNQVVDMMTKTVSTGKTEWADYAKVVGKLSLNASQAKVSFGEANAAFAILTNTMPSSKQAADSLNALLQTSSRIDLLMNYAKNLHIAFDANSYASMNFQHRLAYLGEITGRNATKLTTLLGRQNAVVAATALSTGNFKEYNDALKGINNSSGAADQAFAKVSGGFNMSMQKMQGSIEVLKVKIGQALLPELTKIVNAITPVIVQFTNWMVQNHVVENTIGAVVRAVTGFVEGCKLAIDISNQIVSVLQATHNWYKQNESVIRVASTALTIFYAPALIKAGVEAGVSGARIDASFVASMVRSGIEAAINGARVTASFVVSLLKAGQEAWAAAGKITSGFVASIVMTGTQAVVNATKVTVSFVPSLIKAGVEATVAGARIVASFVASLITTAAQAVITGTTMLVSLVPAIISVVAESVIAAAVAIPSMVAGFAAWAIGAGAAALSTLALTWPILLIGALIAAVVVGIILAVRNWGAISKWLTDTWHGAQVWFSGFWKTVADLFHTALEFLKNLFVQYWPLIIGLMFGPLGLAIGFVILFWPQIQSLFRMGMAAIQSFLQSAGQVLYNIIVSPFADAWGFISGIFTNIRQGIQNTLGNMGATLHTAGVPGFATGVKNFQGGWAVVGENGPELLKLPSDSDVYPHGVGPSMSGAASYGGDQYIYLELDGETLTHFVSHKQSKTVRARMGRRAL